MGPQPGGSGGRGQAKPYAARQLGREERWLELWAFARHRLGLSREEFLLLQARQLDALIRQDRHLTEHGEYMLAQIAAAVMNGGMMTRENRVKVDDLMPSRIRKAAPPQYQSRKRVADNLAQIFSGYVAKG